MNLRDLPQYECAITFRVRLHEEDQLYRAVIDLITHGSGDEAYRDEISRMLATDPATAMMHILMRSHEVGPIGGTTRIGRTVVTVRRLSADGTATAEVRSTADLRWDRE